MNEENLTTLKAVVERTVWPVRATIVRKRRMREELLAHLVSILEEETERLGNEQTALDQAKRRFGDPKQLTDELQRTVPQWDRCSSLCEDFICFRVGESVLHHAARIAVLPCMWFAVMCLLVPPVLLLRGRQYEIGRMMCVLFAASALVSGIAFTLTLLIHGLRASLFCEPSRRSIPFAMVHSLLSALLLPICAFVLSWTVSSDVAFGYTHFRFLCWFSPLVPILLLVLAKEIEKENRCQEEWRCVEIGD